MSNQKEIITDVQNDRLSLLKFSEPVKFGSSELEQLIAEIAQDAEERRRSGNDVRPYYAFDLIRDSRLGALRIPVEQGGGGASIRELFQVLILLAEADPDVAHSLRAHFYQVDNYLMSSPNELSDAWLRIVAEGNIFGNAVTELTTKNVGKLEYETILSPDSEGYRLNGVKYFSTGTMYADWVFVMASNHEGLPVVINIPNDREGVVIEDDWDGIGQKLTGSGTTQFNNVFVKKDEVTILTEEKTPFNSYVQLYLHGVVAGILKNVVTDAKALVHQRKRTFSFAAADTPTADPQLQQIIGELSSIAFTAESIVLSAAEALDIAVNLAVGGNIDYSLSHEASLKAAQVKVVLDELALKASTLLFEVGGASATRQSANLDRHWRNIRTLASHNPTVYKARAIGNYVVNGTQLPLKEVYF